MIHTARQNPTDVSAIIERIRSGTLVSRQKIKHLLTLTDPAEAEILFSAARHVRDLHFGNKIFLYGFLYFSTHCKNDCSFCQYRISNSGLLRYRKSEEEILQAAQVMAASGIHLIDLTMGEDPYMLSSSSNHFSDIVKAVKAKTDLPIMISPGILPEPILNDLAHGGIEWYACYQETHNQELYSQLRCNQSYEHRMQTKRLAKKRGMLVEEGILLGIGETPDDILNSIFHMKKDGMDQVRAMTYIPQHRITIPAARDHNPLKEQLTLAVMRLLMPKALLPASLDVDGLQGLTSRLNAGANVVTSIVPPAKGLAGVANNSLDIEESRRTSEMIVPILNSLGLEVASQQSYRDWINHRKMHQDGSQAVEHAA